MLGNVPAERLKIIEGIAARATRSAKRGLPVSPADLVRAYYHGVAEEDLGLRSTENLAGAALFHARLANVRRHGQTIVRVFNPDPARDGFDSPNTIVALATDDMPFLVDSVGIVFTQNGIKVHFIAHPVLMVERDGRGRLKAHHLENSPADARPESWQFIEVERLDEQRLETLRDKLLQSLDDVACATGDWMQIDQSRVDAFAAATLDDQWIHRAGPVGGLQAAHLPEVDRHALKLAITLDQVISE